MCRAKIPIFAIGGADKVFLILGEVGRSALIHLPAALRTIEKPGEHSHIAHLGRTTPGFADVLHDEKNAFLNDRWLGVLKDRPIRRVVPEFLFALVGLLFCLKVHGMSQVFHPFQ